MPSPESVPAARPAHQPNQEYRPYLDGLRAIAVSGVFVYHLNRSWLPGGYLGVDLFFVLSGYLITTLLVSEQSRSGRISLPRFWSRRAKRLLPALLVLLVVLAITVALSGDPLAILAARGDFLATLFYVANWHFILTSQSYFLQFTGVSLVRHTWSLAIEEQFYIAWPLVVALVLRLAGLRGLAIVAAGVSAASAAALWLLFEPSDPSRAYFGTDSRIFEILVGALPAVAMAGRWRGRLLSASRPLAPPALAAVVAAMVLLADDRSFYYHGGAVAFVAACAVLITGLEAGSRLAAILALRPLVAVGVVSYGVYLWHFPIILFVQNQWGSTAEVPLAALAVAGTAAICIGSYFLVERPIRRGRFGGEWLTGRRLLALAPSASALVGLSILVATSGVETPGWVSASAQPQPSPLRGSPTPVPVGNPNSPWTVGIVGDSVMNSAMPGFRSEATARGFRLIPAAFDGCPVGYQPLYDDSGTRSPFDCSPVRPAYAELVAQMPNLIIWHDLQSVLSRRGSGGYLLLAGSSAWTESLIAEWRVVLDQFLAAGAQVVIVLPPLRSQDLPGCKDSLRLSRCRDIQRQDENIRAATLEFWSRVRAVRGVHLVDVDPLLCPNGYPCPRLISGMEVRLSGWDQTHFTTAGATWYAPRLFDEAISLAVAGDQSSSPATS